MKIVYIGSIYTSDSDFPLVRELSNQGNCVKYYVPLSKQMKKAGTIEINNFHEKTSIIPFSDYDEMLPYKNYINLNESFFINQINFRIRDLRTLFVWLKLFFILLLWKPNVIHFSWPQSSIGKILYLLPFKKILTVHDPFKHSSNTNEKEEQDRIKGFSTVDKLVLLNNLQCNDFCSYYNIHKSKVFFNKMGYFDYYNFISSTPITNDQNYILFFGYISGYKGLEYLCKAMLDVHKKHPQTNLIIAGGGQIYFDFTPYVNLNYIKIYNRYITIPELSSLLKNCLFTVCPYKDATQSGVVQTAFSLNVPMIVTNVGTLSDSVRHMTYGLVVEKENELKLAEAINKLLDDKNLLDKMSLNISNQWKRDMEWSSIVEKYIEIYNS